MMGYNIANFAMGLLVLDETQSIFKYALVLAVSMLPRIIAPVLSGTYFDRHSRRKAIPLMDYCYTTIFLLVGLSLSFGFFNYWLYVAVGLLIGTIDGAYMVAFDSLFPLLTTKKTATKAYSINSLLFPLASAVTVPLTLIGYDSVGAVNLFFASTVLFVITATFELFIIVREPHLTPYQPEKQAKLPASPKELELLAEGADLSVLTAPKEKSSFRADFIEGAKYIKNEKGLLAVTVYFCITSLVGAVFSTLMLPYFRSSSELGMMGYIVVGGGVMLGRITGANVHYHHSIKPDKKFKTALFVYITITLITGCVFHAPIWLMAILMFFEGLLGVTSYNIRISSTQNYVPDDKRGRFNGSFMFFTMMGTVVGQLIAGVLGDTSISIPWLISIVYTVNLIAIFIVVVPNAKHIKQVYNQDI